MRARTASTHVHHTNANIEGTGSNPPLARRLTKHGRSAVVPPSAPEDEQTSDIRPRTYVREPRVTRPYGIAEIMRVPAQRAYTRDRVHPHPCPASVMLFRGLRPGPSGRPRPSPCEAPPGGLERGGVLDVPGPPVHCRVKVFQGSAHPIGACAPFSPGRSVDVDVALRVSGTRCCWRALGPRGVRVRVGHRSGPPGVSGRSADEAG